MEHVYYKIDDDTMQYEEIQQDNMRHGKVRAEVLWTSSNIYNNSHQGERKGEGPIMESVQLLIRLLENPIARV